MASLTVPLRLNPPSRHFAIDRYDPAPWAWPGLTRVQVKQTRVGVHHYALVRKQEIEGFMDGLFGPHEELDLPESARDGVGALGQIRAMLAGAINLLDDTGMPAAPDDLNGLADNLQALEPILEQEMNTVVLSCTRARRQLLAEKQGSKPTAHSRAC